MLRNPATINLERKAAPAVGITQAVYPVPQELKTRCSWPLLERGDMPTTRSSSRAPSTAPTGSRSTSTAHGVACERIHGNRSQAQRTQALAGFKSGRYRVLVATDIAARGIDVEALGHVDQLRRAATCPRTTSIASAARRAPKRPATRSRFVSPDEEGDLRAIERAIGKQLPRVTLPDFDYEGAAAERFEVPIEERIAAIRARKADDRGRARAKAERRAQAGGGSAATPRSRPAPRGRRFGPRR